ncbi:hypothetical protein HAP94_10035 [Acidithiobacillus ferrivorans]|nr:hypothetical protein [Acidithiobacillus ferrivorans]
MNPTPEEVERGLTDDDIGVRREWIQRSDYVPTSAQVERGLADGDKDTQALWTNKVKEIIRELAIKALKDALLKGLLNEELI